MNEVEALRATGALLAAGAEKLLALSNAIERGDAEERARAAREALQVMLASLRWAQSEQGQTAPPSLEEAWVALGAAQGWIESQPPAPDLVPPLDVPTAFHPLVDEVLDLARRLGVGEIGEAVSPERVLSTMRAYARRACRICLNVAPCDDPGCAADSHTHPECVEKH